MTGGVVAALALGLGLAVASRLARRIMSRRDHARREASRCAYDDRQAATRTQRTQDRVATIARMYFPAIKFEAPRRDELRANPTSRLREQLDALPGLRLGEATIGFPAVLPLAERTKHFVVFGKSGYGKTTIALHLMADDLLADRGVCVLGCEAELFRDWLLPLVPSVRASDVIAFRPADPRCTLTWNPLALEEGDDRALAAGQLFAVFKRAVGDDSIGPRADAILSSAFAVLVGESGATLQSVGRFLDDASYRTSIVARCDDPYLREFWTRTFPEYPSGAALPLAHRLNQFLRLPQLRAALCHPVSSFSVREALARDRILYFDVSGLDPDATRLVGQMLLSKFQVELMRREKIPEGDRRPFHVYVDEFHCFADAAEGTWRELLARGRRYGLGLHLFTQHPNQLPRSLQTEILGNVSSVVALNLSASDAGSLRRELLAPDADGVVKPLAAEQLVSLGVGEGFARLGGGACALRVRFNDPIPRPKSHLGERVLRSSWQTYAAPPVPPLESLPHPRSEGPVGETSDLGRGGAKHKLLQRLVREWAEARGFRVMVEHEILGGAGRVDVALVRGDLRFAVEVSVTSSAEEIARSVTKACTAGYQPLVLLLGDDAVRSGIKCAVLDRLDAKDRNRIGFFDPDGLRSFLDGASHDENDRVGIAGYRLAVERIPATGNSHRAQRQEILRLAGSALLRGKASR